MLVIIYLLFFGILSANVALKYKKEVVEILPVVFSAFVVCLYILAFFNRMWFMDMIAIVVTTSIIIIQYREKRFDFFKEWLNKLFKPSVLVFLAVAVVGVILLSDRGIWSNDDMAFWAIDTKTIFSLQGFSQPNLQTVPEYGDYPPVSQIIESWLMHIAGGFDEGLMLSAYFLAMQIYTAPILKNMPSKIIPSLMAFVWLFFIYSIGPNVLFDLSADILMGAIYGCILMLTLYWKKKSLFEYVSLGIMLSVVVLTKSVGIQWALFAIIFIVIMEQPVLKFNKYHLFFVAPIVSWISWNIFCRISGRTTYLTEVLKSSVSGQSSQELYLEYGQAMRDSFFKALKFNQQTSSVNLGLGTTDFIVMFLVFIIIWRIVKLIDTTEFKKIFSFMLLTAVAEYAILLFSVLTMFISETWYTQPEFMIVLLKRYGAPYIMGSILVVLCIIFERTDNDTFDFLKLKISLTTKKQIIWALVMLVYFLFVPFGQEIKKYNGYRNNPNPEEYNYNEAVVQKDIEERKPNIISTVNVMNTVKDKKNEKVLILHDESVWKQYELRDVRYYAAPLCIYSEVADNFNRNNFINNIVNGGYTAVCFISDDKDWSLPYQFDTDKTLKTFTMYSVEICNNEIIFDEM